MSGIRMLMPQNTYNFLDFSKLRLMHDMWCTKAYDMNYSVLADRVRYFKEDEEGVTIMCRAMEEMRNETAERTAFKTRLEALIQIMGAFKVTVEEALKVLQIPESEHARYIAAIKS